MDEFRPHKDGGWAGSGIDAATGELVQDLYGDRFSWLTFLVYLTDDFEAGHTALYAATGRTEQVRSRLLQSSGGQAQ